MTFKPYWTLACVFAFTLLLNLPAYGQKHSNFSIQLSANTLTELGFDNLKENFLNQPSLRLNYNAKKFSFGLEGGILQDKVTTIYDQYPDVFSLIADRNVRSDSWKSTYILVGPSYNLINKLGFRLGVGVKGGFNFLTDSPDYDIVDQVTQLTYERFVPLESKKSKLLIKPSLDLNFYPGGGSLGINFSTSYFNINQPQSASSFGLDFSQRSIPDDIPEPDQIRKVLSRWEISERMAASKTNGLAFSAGISLKIGGTKKKEPQVEPKLPTPKIEKPIKDKEIVADKPKKEKKKKIKPPKPEKIIAEVIDKPKKRKTK